MKILTAKSAHFAAVVEPCGAPQVYTLWQSPKKDRRLQTLIRLARIMSLQQTARRTEFGCVGSSSCRDAMHLEFPKSLKRLADERIVEIKWERVKK